MSLVRAAQGCWIGRDTERGTVALLLVIAQFVLSAAGLVVLAVVTDVAITTAKARTAADAAALAAVGATPLLGGDGDTCAAASDAAAANGARVVRCHEMAVPAAPTQAGSGIRVDVTLSPAGAFVRRLTGEVRASAAAGLRPTGPPPAVEVGAGEAGSAQRDVIVAEL